MQKQRDFIQQPLRRACTLDDDGSRKAPQLLLFIPRQRPPGIDDDRRERSVFPPGHFLEQIIATVIGQVEIHDHAIERRRAKLSKRFAGARHAGDLHAVDGEQVPDAFALTRIVLDDQHAPQGLRELCLQALERAYQFLALGGFQCVADRTHLHGFLLVIRHRYHVHRDVPGPRVAFQLIENAQSGMIGKMDIEQNCAGLE